MHARLSRSWFGASALALALASPAVAQTQTPVGTFVAAAGGAVFGPQTAPFLSIEYGERVHRNVQATIAASYFQNLMDQDLTDSLTALNQSLTGVTGRPWDIRGRDRGVGIVAGARYLVGTGPVRPYAGAGAGALNLRRYVSERQAGDVTAATLAAFGIGELPLTLGSITRPLVELTFGVNMELGRTHLDVGYKSRRTFQFDDTRRFSQFAVGVGVNF
jgi:hypothetical protein